MQIGKLLEEVPKAKSNQYVQIPTDGGKQKTAEQLGITHPERYTDLAKHPEKVEEVPKAKNRYSDPTVGVAKTSKKIGITHPEHYQQLAKHEDREIFPFPKVDSQKEK